ncbi:MAG: TolC family protein [Bacteroidales bacterium]|nr:TolC family protein [Bacteroidales bacterium]
MNPVKCFVVALLFLSVRVSAQHSFTLPDAIRIATDSSLTAFRYQNLYLASYWDYRSYLALKKPSLTLITTLIDYNRTLTKRYNSVLDRDEYRQQQNIYSYANASVSQNIPFTGGSIYIDSEVGRLQNFGNDEYTQFSTVPLRIGFIQPLLGYNNFKWKRKIEPLKYEKARKQYIMSAETIALQITDYFFSLLEAQNRVAMATTNRANADTLYQIGMKRLEIATLSQADVLTLKVDALNARNELANAMKQLSNARFSFFSFLRLPEDPDIVLTLPDFLSSFQVDFTKALTEAQTNNPTLLDSQQQLLESASNMEKIKREGLLNASLTASYGLNQQNSKLPDAYRNPLDQQRASVGLSVPVIDWGQRRGQYNMAKSNYEVVRLSAEQDETDFRQTVMLAVSDFNMQQDVVKTAFESREAARQAYNITKQRFMIGKSDVNSLALALERQDQSNLNYIDALRLYWKYYYTIRQLTLFDFEKNQTLMREFDEKVGF